MTTADPEWLLCSKLCLPGTQSSRPAWRKFLEGVSEPSVCEGGVRQRLSKMPLSSFTRTTSREQWTCPQYHNANSGILGYGLVWRAARRS